MRACKRFLKENAGSALLEYVLLVSLAALVVIGALTLIDTKTRTTFNQVSSQLK
jgi:Flp pilus assembly pilin Flp